MQRPRSTILPFAENRPTRPGFYFIKFRGQLGGKLGVSAVKVSEQLGCSKRFVAFWDGESFPVEYESFLAFSGPIQVPEF